MLSVMPDDTETESMTGGGVIISQQLGKEAGQEGGMEESRSNCKIRKGDVREEEDRGDKSRGEDGTQEKGRGEERV